MNKKSSRLYYVMLLFILLIAGWMRYQGLWFDYPLHTHPDEPRLVDNALRILSDGDYNPHFFNYPSLMIYLNVLLFKIIQLICGPDLPVIHYYIAARLLTMLLSLACLFLVAETGRILFSQRTGLAAACFTACSPLFYQNSLTATVDMPMTMWCTAVIFCATLILKNGYRIRPYLAGGMAAGFAIGCKYTAALSFSALCAAHTAIVHRFRDLLRLNIVYAGILTAVIFLMTTPYALLDYPTFRKAIDYESQHYSNGHDGAESTTSTSYNLYGKNLLFNSYGIAAGIPALIGGIAMLCFHRKKLGVILIFPLLLFLFAGHHRVFFPRNMTAIIPILALFSGYGIDYVTEVIYQRCTRKDHPAPVPLYAHCLAGMLFVIFLSASAHDTWGIMTYNCMPSTYSRCLQWVGKKLPENVRIGREFYTPPIEEYYPTLRVEILGHRGVLRHPELILELDYIMVSSGDYARYMNNANYTNEAAVYISFFATHKHIKTFHANKRKERGPEISIYQIIR